MKRVSQGQSPVGGRRYTHNPFLYVSFLFLLLAVSFLSAIPQPVRGATTLYYIGSNIACNHDWNTVGCWSLSSGGTPSATVPTSVDDVVIDPAGTTSGTITVNDGDAFAHDIIWTQNIGLSIRTPGGGTSSMSVHSISFSLGAGKKVFISRFGDVGTSTLKFSGTISSNIANPDCEGAGIIGGVCLYGSAASPDNRAFYIQYTGPNPFGSVSQLSFLDSASVGKTVYCSPGCVNDGTNAANIVFGPSPTPSSTSSVCDLDAAIPGVSLTTLLVILIGVGIMIAILVFFGFFGGSSYVGEFTVKTLEPTRIILGIIGVVVIVTLVAAIIPRMTC